MIKRFDFKYLILVPLSLLFITNGCQNQRGSGSGEDTLTFQETDIDFKEISSKTMEDMIENVSSPVELSALLKEMGIPFLRDYIAMTDISLYNFDAEKAFVLGVYAADLGYLNMYNKTGSVLETLSNIRYLAQDLNLSQFFDFANIKRLATVNNNIDSLIYLSVRSFNQMDRYLRETGRSYLSALMLQGVWIEGLYLLSKVYEKYPDARLSEKIGEQKIMLEQLILIMKNYSGFPKVDVFTRSLQQLKSAFDAVQITFEKGDPKFVEKDGMLTIIQNDKSIVSISDDTLKKIAILTDQLRSNLLKIGV